MTHDDWLIAKLEAVEVAAEAVRAALDDVAALLAPARAARVAGVPLPVIAQSLVETAAEPRRRTVEQFVLFEQSVGALRASVVRALVDDEGASFSGLAKAMGISRQAVTRLYRAGRS